MVVSSAWAALSPPMHRTSCWLPLTREVRCILPYPHPGSGRWLDQCARQTKAFHLDWSAVWLLAARGSGPSRSAKPAEGANRRSSRHDAAQASRSKAQGPLFHIARPKAAGPVSARSGPVGSAPAWVSQSRVWQQGLRDALRSRSCACGSSAGGQRAIAWKGTGDAAPSCITAVRSFF
jgi:hypothetical protein